MRPSDDARAHGAGAVERTHRLQEEQARLDADFTEALDRCAEAEAERERQAMAFCRPQFRRREVLDALSISGAVFANWQDRRQIELDADDDRETAGQRRYSARDVLRLALACELHKVGVAATRLRVVLEAIEAVFPLSPRNRLLAANVPCAVIVEPSGAVAGPFIGSELELDARTGAFIVLRTDGLLRSSLERLGWTVARDTANDIRAAVDHLERLPAGGEVGSCDLPAEAARS